MSRQSEPVQEAVLIEQAADWVSRIEGGMMTREDEAALKAWLDHSLEHTRVFQRMSAVLRRTDVLHASAANDPAPSPAHNHVPRRRVLPYVGLALAAACALVAVLFVTSMPDARYATGIGERRSVTLEDGSMITLNTLTKVSVRYAAARRYIELEDGEALFQVTPDKSRPFVVQSADLSVSVLGTTFNVAAWGPDTRVTVIEGRVAVSSNRDEHGPRPRADVAPQLTLTRGEQVAWRDGVLGKPEMVDSGRVGAWRDGWLYFEKRTLADLVDRLNRQFPGEISIADPALAAMTVNVVLQLDDRAGTLRRLEQLLPIAISESPGERAVIHRRR